MKIKDELYSLINNNLLHVYFNNKRVNVVGILYSIISDELKIMFKFDTNVETELIQQQYYGIGVIICLNELNFNNKFLYCCINEQYDINTECIITKEWYFKKLTNQIRRMKLSKITNNHKVILECHI